MESHNLTKKIIIINKYTYINEEQNNIYTNNKRKVKVILCI